MYEWMGLPFNGDASCWCVRVHVCKFKLDYLSDILGEGIQHRFCDLSSLTVYWTWGQQGECQVLTHWTVRKFPSNILNTLDSNNRSLNRVYINADLFNSKNCSTTHYLNPWIQNPDWQKHHIVRADYMLNIFKYTWMDSTPNLCITQWSTILVYLNDFVRSECECLSECDHIPTSERINVYVSDYECMDVSMGFNLVVTFRWMCEQ